MKRRGKARPRRSARRPEKRRYPRAEAEWDVVVEAPGRRAQKGKVVGLSPFGTKLRVRATKAGPPEGATLWLRFAPHDAEPPLAIKGLVWRTDADGQALVFVNLGSQDFLRLKKLVAILRGGPA